MSDFLKSVDNNVDVDMDALKVPYLKILPESAPEANPKKAEYIEGAEEGYFINSATNKVYGNKIKVITTGMAKKYIEWKAGRGGLVAVHNTEPNVPIDKTIFREWKLPNGNILEERYEYYCVLPDDPETPFIILSLKSSNIKFAKAWNSMIRFSRLDDGSQAPWCAYVWELETKYNDGGKDKQYYALGVNGNAAIKRDRLITKDEFNDNVSGLLENMSNLQTLSIAEESPKQNALPDNTTKNDLEEVGY